MRSSFLTSKKASATVVFLVISVLIISSGVIITNQIKKSNDDNVAGTGLVLLDNEQDISQDSDSPDDQITFTFSDNKKSSSKRSSGGGGGGGSSSSNSQTYNEPEIPDNNENIDNQASENQTETNDTETLENQTETNYIEESNENETFSDGDLNVSEINVSGPYVGWCQPGFCESKNYESAEGPGGSYCCSNEGGSSGYEECTKYTTKSTVYIYDYWTDNLKFTETDYCSDTNTLQEAYMDCQWLSTDRVLWKEKDCNDYDQETDWYYYCDSNEVRKVKYFYNYGCSNGACKFISGTMLDNVLISKKGDNDYCSKRKEGDNNGWQDCTLCGQGDYDCDSDSECYGSLECMGASVTCLVEECGCCKSGERWDSTNNRCCECDSVSDCCDGCNYRPNTYVCDYHYGSYYYDCPDGQCLGDDVKRRDRKRYCSGLSSACTGLIYWNNWKIYDSCGSNEFCDSDNVGYNTSFSCSTAQCPQGVCCETDCGEYTFSPSTKPCALGADYTCLNGEGTSYPGSDVYMRLKKRYCTGSSPDCVGAEIPFGDWSQYVDCTLDQYCVQGDDYCHNCGYHTYWACHGNDVYYYDDCNNLEDLKEECGTLGCFNGECVPLSECYNDSGCGTDGLIGNPYCSEDDVYDYIVEYTCNNPGESDAYCSNYTSNQVIDDCPEDSYSDNYCYDDDVYQNFTDRGCLDGVCFENTTMQFVQECGEPGCFDGGCVYVECYNDSDCGENYYTGNPFCQSNDVWQNQVIYTCNYAGAGNSYCSNSTIPVLKEDCETDYCENWGSGYCKLDDVYHGRTCHDKGCGNGACFDDTYTEEEKVEECGVGEYTGSNYCYDGDVYRDYITRTCSNSQCISPTSKKKIEDCAYGCTSARCKIQVCSYGGCYYV